MSLIKEFREFAMRGNVVDMAVGIVIGAAFGKIVSSLVADIIMPPVGLLTGGVDFKKQALVIKEGTLNEAGELIGQVAINYGSFINTVIDFVIIAFAIFMVIKLMNNAKKRFEKQQEQAAAAPAVPPADVQLLTEIRDLLKQDKSA